MSPYLQLQIWSNTSSQSLFNQDPKTFAMAKSVEIPGVKLGGACMFMEDPKSSLATATVQRSSEKGGSATAAIAVFFFGTKF